MSVRGLLIINADDLGANHLATERALSCFENGSITSATAMVFMADSVHAAECAVATGLPVGLHLNLTQPFDGAVPPSIARRQAGIARFLSTTRRRRLAFAPNLMRAIAAAVRDQLKEFRHLYGSEPTHLDGHHHVHLNPTVVLCLPRRSSVRPAHELSNRRLLGAVPRRLRDAVLRGLHPSVDHFFALSAIHPELGGVGLGAAFGLASTSSVEIMVHPDRRAVFEVLARPEWRRLLESCHLGSYADLRARASFGRGG
jgi:chitin disaccharide deacetylase